MKRSIILCAVIGCVMAIGLMSFNQFTKTSISEEAEEFKSLHVPAQNLRATQANNSEVMRAGIEEMQDRWMATYNDPDAEAWVNVGPTGLGRVAEVETDPTNGNTVFCGAANGGVWKSTNGGSSWKWVFKMATYPGKGLRPITSQSIGDIAIAPSDNKIVWVGTGETNCGGGSLTYPGCGVFKSTDGGETWEYKGLPESYYVGRIAIHPTNPDIVYAAVVGTIFWGNEERGVYKSTNGGDTWTKVRYVDKNTGAIDVRIHPTSPDRIFACFWKRIRHEYWRDLGGGAARIHRSNDGGATWSIIGSGLPTSDLGKNTICISESNPNIIYSVYQNALCQIKGIYRSSDGGTTWQSTGGKPPTSIFNYWGFWYGQIRVHPTNSQEVVTFGVTAYRSTNGGGSWSSISGINHVDHHDVSWSRQNTNTFYWGNDGGMRKGTNGLSGSKSIIGTGSITGDGSTPGGLCISQCYTIDVASGNENYRYTGLQDNGVVRTTSGSTNSWSSIIGGDGEYIRVDQGDNRYVIGCYQNGAYQRSTNSGSGMQRISGITGRNNWCSPVSFDSVSGRTFLASNYVYRANRGSGSFSRIGNDLTNGDHSADVYEYGSVFCIDANNGVAYAGTDDGNVWVNKSSNSGSSWTKVYSGEGWIRKIHMDKSVSNGSTAYFALSLYRWGKNKWAPKIFKTTNFGTDWTDISGDLPAPVTTNEVLVDCSNARKGWLYVATDYGVWVSTNGGVNWKSIGKGMPMMTCNDMVLHKSGHLYVGTFGRGIWRLDLNQVSINDLGNAKFEQTQFMRIQPTMNAMNIKFQLKRQGNVMVSIFDMAGRNIKTLVNKPMAANKLHTISWDKTNNRGTKVAAGNYICRIIGNSATLAEKIVVR